MRIITIKNPLTRFTSDKKYRPQLPSRKLRAHNEFSAWPVCAKRNLSYVVGYNNKPALDIKHIEQFLKRHFSLAHPEPLYSDENGAALERVIAIKKMANLMQQTLSAIKTFSQLSHFRG
jgi:hypothetical protein